MIRTRAFRLTALSTLALTEQCRLLGPLRYRLKNLTTTGKLSMEAPGYCMGARARLRRGDDRAVTRERMFDDANAAFAGSADSAKVNAALRASCPEISLFPLARFLQ